MSRPHNDVFNSYPRALSERKVDYSQLPRVRAKVDDKRREMEEKLRREAEARAAEERRIADEQARLVREEQEKAEAEGRAEDAQAAAELAEEAQAQAQAVDFTPLPVIPREKPKGERETWHHHELSVDEVMQLAMGTVATYLRTAPCADPARRDARRALANALDAELGVAWVNVPPTAILANNVLIGQQVRSLKGELRWPGVRVYSVKDVAAPRAGAR